MSISKKSAVKFVKRNWFWIALVIIVFIGYTFGKDWALRDNAKMSDASAYGAD